MDLEDNTNQNVEQYVVGRSTYFRRLWECFKQYLCGYIALYLQPEMEHGFLGTDEEDIVFFPFKSGKSASFSDAEFEEQPLFDNKIAESDSRVLVALSSSLLREIVDIINSGDTSLLISLSNDPVWGVPHSGQ